MFSPLGKRIYMDNLKDSLEKASPIKRTLVVDDKIEEIPVPPCMTCLSQEKWVATGPSGLPLTIPI